MTLREVFQEFAIARLRQIDEFNRDVTHAYQTVRIYVETKAKKRMPKLSNLLASGPEKSTQTVGHMASMLHMLSKQYGIPMRKAART